MNSDILKRGLFKKGFSLDKEKEEKFKLYSDLLVIWNEKINLTSITDDDGISIKHFLDSIIPIFYFDIPKNSSLIDVGTGAGFPGIPIKIIRDDIKITLMDSLNKRINFLNEVSEKLSLENVKTVHMRAEEGGREKEYREKYDFAVSRAVASLRVLSEFCLPFVKVGGIFVAFKSYDIDEEIAEAKSMIGNLGGKIKNIIEVNIPESDLSRKVVLIEKITNTPLQFPRRINKIK